MNAGKVYLVGAGPGDPGLITVKGLGLLRRADVVLYDRLIPLALLDETRPDAEHIDVGKLPQKHRLSQEDINRMLIEHAQSGKLVVRLKGGDPFVFGRGGEEVAALRRAGIEVNVVPGLTSGLAVPAVVGIPVTHRDIAHGVALVTGHAADGVAEPDWTALVQSGLTLVIYMGVARMGELAAKLRNAGMAASRPVALIAHGTRPQQRAVTTTLANMAEASRTAGIASPAIIVIGDVAAFAQTRRGEGALAQAVSRIAAAGVHT